MKKKKVDKTFVRRRAGVKGGFGKGKVARFLAAQSFFLRE